MPTNPVLHSVPPEQRLVGLAEHNQLVNLAKYQCPHCGQITAFATLHELVSSPTKSPFDTELKIAFDAATEQKNLNPQLDSIDFLCRTCAKPVRLLFESIEFAMASYNCYPREIIETTC